MDDEHKDSPGGAPAGGVMTSERLEQALADPRARGEVLVRLKVTGGLPGEFTPFSLAVDGTGSVSFTSADRSQLEQSERSARVDEGVVRELFGMIEADDLAAAAERQVPIPPDSLVAFLEVQAGGVREQIVFMADEEQAKTAGFRLPERIERLVRRMIEIGEETTMPEQSLLGSR